MSEEQFKNPIEELKDIIKGEKIESFKYEKKESKGRLLFWGDYEMQKVMPHFQTHCLYVGFGQQGAGKTQFALNVARINKDMGKKVMFVMFEMGVDRLLNTYGYREVGLLKENYLKRKLLEEKFLINEGIISIDPKYSHFFPNFNTNFNPHFLDQKMLEVEETKKKWEGIYFYNGAGKSLSKILADAKENEIDLVIIDNLGHLHTGDTSMIEHDRFEAVSNELATFVQEVDCGVYLIHHASKQEKTAKDEFFLEKKIRSAEDEDEIERMIIKGGRLQHHGRNTLRGLACLRGNNKINDCADDVFEIARPSKKARLDNIMSVEESNGEFKNIYWEEDLDNKVIFKSYKGREFETPEEVELIFNKGNYELYN